MINLTKIIFHATDGDLANISKFLHKTKETHVSCIAFKCTHESKEEVVNKLIDAGYRIEQNDSPSLCLESYMVEHNDHK